MTALRRVLRWFRDHDVACRFGGHYHAHGGWL